MSFFIQIILMIALIIQGHQGQLPVSTGAAGLSDHEEALTAFDQAVHDREFWKALQYAGKAYKLAENADLPPGEMARYVSAYANARAETGGLYQAQELYRECVDLLEGQEKFRVQRAYCLLNEGEVTGMMGDTQKGLSLIREAVALVENDTSSPQAGTLAAMARFTEIAVSDEVMGADEDFYRSRYEKSLALLPEMQEALGENDKRTAYLHALVARYLASEGLYREAIDHLVPAYDGLATYPIMKGFAGGLREEIKTAPRWRVASKYDDALYVLHDGCATLLRNGMTKVCIERSWYPPIPAEAIEKNQYGFAELSYDIDEEGKPQNVRVLRSWPEDYYGDEAARYLSAWTFKPPVTDEGDIVAVTGLNEFFTFDPERVDYEG